MHSCTMPNNCVVHTLDWKSQCHKNLIDLLWLAYNGTRNLIMTELQINCSITQAYHTHTQERMMRLYKIIIIIIIANIGQKKELLDLIILLVSNQSLNYVGLGFTMW